MANKSLKEIMRNILRYVPILKNKTNQPIRI